jgi:membrane protein implicated in regulation of membrane protease activity
VRLDLTLVLYWASLGISAALVVVFLWLMREGSRKSETGNRESKRPPE